MASAPDPSAMTRDELEARVSELEETVERLEPLAELLAVKGGTDADEAELADVLVAGEPIGLHLRNRRRETRALSEYLFGEAFGAVEIGHHIDAFGTVDEDLDVAGSGRSAGGPSQAVRDQLLPAHEIAVDLRAGRERVKGLDEKEKRAADLFYRLTQKASDDPNAEPQPGIENSNGTLKISSPAAQEMIVEFDDEIDNAYSDTAKRAFQALQRLTKREDCDCDSIGDCPHGLVMFQPGSTRRAAVNTARLVNYCEDVEAAVENYTADVSTDIADDGAHGSDASEDAVDADPFDALADAEPVRDNLVANVDVSSHDGPALGAEDGHTDGDTHE